MAPKNVTEAWVRSKLADRVRPGPIAVDPDTGELIPAVDEIVLEEREQDGGTITTSMPLPVFLERYGTVTPAGDIAAQVKAIDPLADWADSLADAVG